MCLFVGVANDLQILCLFVGIEGHPVDLCWSDLTDPNISRRYSNSMHTLINVCGIVISKFGHQSLFYYVCGPILEDFL